MISQQLKDHLDKLRASSDSSRRVIIGIAGAPGGGKTILALDVVEYLNSVDPESAVHLPMDGFHLANSTLKRLRLSDRKGALETFDGWGFLNLLSRVRTEVQNVVYAPSFERTVDEGVAGEIAINPQHRFVVTEGNYLLIDEDPWSRTSDYLDESWYCDTPDDVRLVRLVDRHIRHGRSLEAAEAWAQEVDGANAIIIASTKHRADYVVSGVDGRFLI